MPWSGSTRSWMIVSLLENTETAEGRNLQSGRTVTDPIEDVACSDEKTREIQTMFQTCSHSTATSVYQTIQDITSVKIISHKLCKALTTIGTVCIKHLYQCFAEEDVKQMRKSHLEEMKTFLLRISEEKVAEDVFENCVVMEFVESDEQEQSNITVDRAAKNDEQDEGENNKKEVKNPENIVDIETTTEELSTQQIKGSRSVETTSTGSTISVTTMVTTDKKETTEWNDKIEHTSDVLDEIPGDKGDELVTEKDDKVVDEKVEESAVIPPEEHTSGGGRQSMTTIVSIATLILIIDKLW